MSKNTKTLDFEQSINELETLVATLENGELSLEESLSTFERGIKLTKECQQQLSQAQQKVSLLVAEGGELAQVEFTQEAPEQ